MQQHADRQMATAGRRRDFLAVQRAGGLLGAKSVTLESGVAKLNHVGARSFFLEAKIWEENWDLSQISPE